VAKTRATHGFLWAAKHLGAPAVPLEPLPGPSPAPAAVTAKQHAAIKRLLHRATLSSMHPLQLLINPDAASVEAMFVQSFQSGMSLDLQGSTVQDQVSWHSCATPKFPKKRLKQHAAVCLTGRAGAGCVCQCAGSHPGI
jgi:hypothetical protein